MNIDTVTIDFWDTIFVYPMGEDIVEKRIEHAYSIFKNYGQDYKSLQNAFLSIFNYFEEIWIKEKRTLSTMEMMQYVCQQIDQVLHPEDIEKLVHFNQNLILEEKLLKVDYALEVIAELGQIYKLVLISDTGFETGDIIRTILKEHNLLRVFSDTVFSNETGFSKPDVRAFEIARKSTNSNFDKMLHIGDRENTDIKGAINAGMKSILFAGIRDKDFQCTIADFRVKSWKEIADVLL